MKGSRFHDWLTVLTLASFFTISGFDLATAKTPSPPAKVLEDSPPAFRDQFMPRHPAPYPVAKRPGHYTAGDWARAIDSVWGPGLSWAEHKSIWENFWVNTDLKFACFPGLDTSVWQDVWNRYYPEILDTVSRGRLDAIVGWANASLRESHQMTYDSSVVCTRMDPGVPLMVIGAWGVADHFGAGLTSLPDSSLLVYKAVNPHPLGLAPGDIVLGYDGRPWTTIYPELIAAELPYSNSPGNLHPAGRLESCPQSFAESFLVAAGQNWHLFDTIDIVKYGSDDTVHLPTSLLVGQDMSLWASEQLDVPGVEMPDISAGQFTSWGVITGTNIGYVYSLAFLSGQINAWLIALDSLQNVYDVSGVILDFRTNFGSDLLSSFPGLDFIFDSSWQVMETDLRCGGHFELCRETSPAFRQITFVSGDIDAHWDRPLAILTGPGAMSGGDVNPAILSMHPMAKVFGKPSAGAFSGVTNSSLHTGWECRTADHNVYLADRPGDYLVRKEFPSVRDFPWVDYEPVWLTPDGVAQGRDDVVEAAKAWIITADVDRDGVVVRFDNCPEVSNHGQEDADADSLGDACDPCPTWKGTLMTGDVNLSASLTSADIIYLVNYVFKSGAEPQPVVQSGDVNCSGSPSVPGITSADIIYLVNHVFKSGPVPCDRCAMAAAL